MYSSDLLGPIKCMLSTPHINESVLRTFMCFIRAMVYRNEKYRMDGLLKKRTSWRHLAVKIETNNDCMVIFSNKPQLPSILCCLKISYSFNFYESRPLTWFRHFVIACCTGFMV